ncbi:thiol reductant ABC exporter subunit CydC [Sabulicella rubraurantiaca]|uniref:thiol reductant ABC exporter subunit CydC n=1 Tax=Sabulicella rubraurantiaca TaxID=2811429 RepID=UPI001A96BCDA|nr:thiol reductant ABC exporter subunit CydC [Sabulicella rubraurantiaca]
MWADLARVLRLWAPRRAALAGALLVAMASAMSGLAILALAGQGVAAGLAGAGAVALLALRPLVLLRPALRWLERYASHAAAFRALADTRVWFFRRLAERMPGGIGHRGGGDLLGRLIGDVDALDRLYLAGLVPGAAALAAVLAIAALLGAAPGLLALVALPLVVALLLPPLLAPGAARAAAETAEARGALRAAATDPLAGMEDLLAAGAEERARAKLEEADRRMMAAQRRLARRGALAGALGMLLGQAALLGALSWGLAGGAPPLALLAVLLAAACAEPLSLLPRAGAALAFAGAGARRLFEAADTPPPVTTPAGPAPEPEDATLALEAVEFAWAPGRPVLRGASFVLRPGERVAILGPSGSGKSSLAALLQRLRDPDAGRITLGGVELALLPPEEVRRRITVLSQHARIFDDTVAANLRIAAPEAPDAALWRALAKAGLARKVEGLPEGLETRCGEGGTLLSGGEARRLALARALLPAAPILVLDEPTAGLDAETERAFLQTLAIATEGRSLLLLTHRLTGVEQLHRAYRWVEGVLLEAPA